jgi:large subunit ribosomal protein L17
MRKHYFGRQLKRDANERKALFKNLLTSLVLEERITTTEAKAKAIRAAADKLVTKAKKADAFARLAPDVRHVAAAKLITAIAPRFADRQGGYTRIIRVGRRVADNAPQVIMEWVVRGDPTSPKLRGAGKSKKKDAKATNKEDAKKTAVKSEAAIKAKSAAPKKEAKVAKSAAPKKTVTRQKKG